MSSRLSASALSSEVCRRPAHESRQRTAHLRLSRKCLPVQQFHKLTKRRQCLHGAVHPTVRRVAGNLPIRLSGKLLWHGEGLHAKDDSGRNRPRQASLWRLRTHGIRDDAASQHEKLGTMLYWNCAFDAPASLVRPEPSKLGLGGSGSRSSPCLPRRSSSKVEVLV